MVQTSTETWPGQEEGSSWSKGALELTDPCKKSTLVLMDDGWMLGGEREGG